MTTIAEVKYLVIHCSATPPTMHIGVQEIDRWHRENNGWHMIGYHRVIRRSGVVEQGRPDNMFGAHALGYNHCSLSVCLIGGIDIHGNPVNNFTAYQWDSLKVTLYDWLCKYPNAQVVGHRDLLKQQHARLKECPCFDVKEWLQTWLTK